MVAATDWPVLAEVIVESAWPPSLKSLTTENEPLSMVEAVWCRR